MVANYLQKKMDELKPRYLKDIIKFLKQIPEYKQASTENSGPKILVGNENNRSGKVFVDMTGGTEGPQQMVKKLADAGVGTVICMHYKDVLRKEAEKNHINVIIAGHIASDTFGLNLLLDELLKIGDFEILCCSGFRRFSRN
jgi:putative NIF3 family GTP cyclohydrolase 1 type 2